MSQQSQESLVVYADYVCPFCYLGRRSLEAYEDERDEQLQVEWRPFDLRAQKRGPDGEIDHSVDDGKDEAYFDQVRENVARLREQYGAEEMLGIDEVPDTDSLPTQAAASYVQEAHPDQFRAFDDALYEALWVDGRDVGDPEVIADVAESVGLDGEAVRAAATDEDRREALREQFGNARRQGVTGVPTFVYDEHAARGAVPPEHLERLVEGD